MASTAVKYITILRPKGGISYLLKDEFTTTVAAGSVNGTTADGTGQTRTVTDTGSRLSIDANGLLFSGLAAGALLALLIDMAIAQRETADTLARMRGKR